jgi:hypothetical protein
MFRSVMGVPAYPECSGFVSDFEHLYFFKRSDSKLVHNYNGLNFQWNFEHLSLFKWSDSKLVHNYTGLKFNGITPRLCSNVALKRGGRKCKTVKT